MDIKFSYIHFDTYHTTQNHVRFFIPLRYIQNDIPARYSEGRTTPARPTGKNLSFELPVHTNCSSV